MTAKSRVAQHLVSNPKVWLDTNTIREVGGASGTRRLRDLRAEGWSIKSQRDGTSFQYMLTKVPAKKVVAQYV